MPDCDAVCMKLLLCSGGGGLVAGGAGSIPSAGSDLKKAARNHAMLAGVARDFALSGATISTADKTAMIHAFDAVEECERAVDAALAGGSVDPQIKLTLQRANSALQVIFDKLTANWNAGSHGA